MKTAIIILSIFVLLFTGCGARRNVEQNPATFDEGVVINGVRWATRNVGGHGRFTRNPHDAGVLFTFFQAQNACPPGWRLPTREEFQSLIVGESEWMRVNGVRGRSFGTAPNQLFLPAAGIHWANGAFSGAGSWGYYWIGASPSGDMGGRSFSFGRYGSGVGGGDRLNGFSVRCVADIN